MPEGERDAVGDAIDFPIVLAVGARADGILSTAARAYTGRRSKGHADDDSHASQAEATRQARCRAADARGTLAGRAVGQRPRVSLNREAEVRHLAESDAHIADAERQVTRQAMMVEQLRTSGRDTLDAERTLASFTDILETLSAHRALIVSAIRQIDAGLI